MEYELQETNQNFLKSLSNKSLAIIMLENIATNKSICLCDCSPKQYIKHYGILKYT